MVQQALGWTLRNLVELKQTVHPNGTRLENSEQTEDYSEWKAEREATTLETHSESGKQRKARVAFCVRIACSAWCKKCKIGTQCVLYALFIFSAENGKFSRSAGVCWRPIYPESSVKPVAYRITYYTCYNAGWQQSWELYIFKQFLG